MRIRIKGEPLFNGIRWLPIGSVIQVADGDGERLIAEGKADAAGEDTPCREDPTFYDNCRPLDAGESAAKKALKPEKMA